MNCRTITSCWNNNLSTSWDSGNKQCEHILLASCWNSIARSLLESKYEFNKLQNVQNAAARVIACLRKYDHISPTLRNLHWLPVQERIVFKINLMCFKIVNNIAPKYLQELVCRYEPTRILRSSADKWRLTEQPYKLKTYGHRAFSVAAPKLWNTLPVDIRSITDINTFKSKLKTHLFKLAYDI